MTSLKKLSAVLAVSLPLLAVAQPAAEPPPAAPPAAAPAPAAPAPAAPAPAATPAAAKPPLAQIYGTLNVNFQVEEAPNPTHAVGTASPNVRYRFGLSTDSSNIGVRGTADTSVAGIGVVYQCETSAAIDGIGSIGLCNRNSRLGVSSPYGTLFYGNWDSPYKAAWYGTKADDAFGNTDVYDATGIMGSPGFNTKSTAGVTGAATGTLPVFDPTKVASIAASTTTTFAVRAADSVVYHSPKYMGASVKLQYSANRFADNKEIRAPELYSAVLNYDFGPFSVLGAYEDHEDWNTLRSRDAGWSPT